jgi:regulatory protein YycI of two-component signal transduction system YycFG
MLDALGAPMFSDNAKRAQIEKEAAEKTFSDNEIKGLVLDIIKRKGKSIGAGVKRFASDSINELTRIIDTVNMPVESLGNAVINAAKWTLRDPMKSTPTERLLNRIYIATEDILRKEYASKRIKEENSK